MKLTIATKDLSDALKRVSSCVKKVDAVLGHVHLEADREGGLTISGTDLAREVKVHVAANVSVPGSRTAHAGILMGFAGYAPGEIVQITFDEGRLVVKSGRSWVNVPTFVGESYYSPLAALSQGESFVLPDGALLDAMSSICFCVADDINRPFLEGVWLHPDGQEWVCVATNYHRFMRIRLNAPESVAPLRPLIIPKNSVQLAAALFPGPVEMLVGKTMLSFFNEDTSFTTSLVNGKIPEGYEKQLVPGPHSVSVSRQRLFKSVNYVSNIHNNVGVSCRDNSMKLFAARTDGTRVEDEFECDGSLPFDLTINSEYLKSVVGALEGDDLTLKMTSATKPIFLSDGRDNVIGLVVPRSA